MGQFISSIFNPGGEAKKAAAAAAAENRITLARQESQQQQNELDTKASSSVLSKTPRGRRLLMGDTAPVGASATVGG